MDCRCLLELNLKRTDFFYLAVIDSEENNILVHDSTKFLIFMFSMHIEQASLEQQT